MTDFFELFVPFIIDFSIAVVKSPVFITIFIFLIVFGLLGLIKELKYWV